MEGISFKEYLYGKKGKNMPVQEISSKWYADIPAKQIKFTNEISIVLSTECNELY